MKVSDLIAILEDVKKFHGDKYIWDIEDLDGVCTREFKIELVSSVKQTDFGWSSGKASENVAVEVTCHYDEEGNLEDRSITEIDED